MAGAEVREAAQVDGGRAGGQPYGVLLGSPVAKLAVRSRKSRTK